MKVGITVFKRNRDLTDVFNDRWKANHNKALEKTVQANKSSTLKRSYGLESNPVKSDNKPIGYNNMNGRR